MKTYRAAGHGVAKAGKASSGNIPCEISIDGDMFKASVLLDRA